MNAHILFLVVIAYLCDFSFSENEKSCDTTQYEHGVYHAAVVGSGVFAPQLYQAVSSMEGNLVIAPFSVAVLLALLRAGTNGYGLTGRQLSDAVHLAQDNFLIAQGFRQLLDKLSNVNDTSEDEAILFLANRMFLQSGYNIEEDFKETAVDDFKSGVQELNFTDDTEKSRETINEWVEDSTMGKITDLIPDGSLTSKTRLVLVNAIYFKGPWLHPFLEENTKDETFHVSDSEKVTVPMMHGSFKAQYGEFLNVDATALRLPYRGEDFEAEMIIVLPNTINGLADLEKKFDTVEVIYTVKQVNVTIPRFGIERSFNLNEFLMKLGVTEVFGPNADLTGISKDEQLYVDQVMQKAFISVNENGTEAAAATAVGVTTSAVTEPVEFKADHPFLFLIRDKNNFYFFGRVSNPAK